MNYSDIVPSTFISRPNRFIAQVNICGTEQTVHVKNTGRCRELLIPGSRVWLRAANNPARKTKYDLIAVEKTIDGVTHTVNIDSQAPNAAAEEWLRSGGLFSEGSVIRREVTCGGSRFDFCIENGRHTSYLEVKGVTLEENGVALFPDAPTQRGVKHIRELISCAGEGLGAYILFVIQMKGIHLFRPNDRTHKEFGNALREAASVGVNILAVDCNVTPGSMTVDSQIPVDLSAHDNHAIIR